MHQVVHQNTATLISGLLNTPLASIPHSRPAVPLTVVVVLRLAVFYERGWPLCRLLSRLYLSFARFKFVIPLLRRRFFITIALSCGLIICSLVSLGTWLH